MCDFASVTTVLADDLADYLLKSLNQKIFWLVMNKVHLMMRVQFFFDSDYIDMPCTYITNGRQLAKNN